MDYFLCLKLLLCLMEKLKCLFFSIETYKETKETPVTPLKEFQASVTDIGETVYTATVGWVLHQAKLYGRVAKKKNH